MAFKRSLNLITIRQASLGTKLEVAAAAGYDGVGLWVDDLRGAARSDQDLRGVAESLARHRLVPAELCFVGGWMYPEPSEEAAGVHERAEEAFRLAQAVGCQCVAACASAGAGDIEDAARAFAGLCSLAEPFGVRLALEFLGSAQQVKDVRTAWQIVEMADAANGGLLIDTFHFYKGGSELADLEWVPGQKVFLVHVNDSPDLPREELEDRHRILPGTGVIPIEVIAATLVNNGYDGFFSLELFNQEYWDTDPRLVAQEGLRSMERAGI